MKKLALAAVLAAMLLPGAALAQYRGYQGYKGYQGYSGYSGYGSVYHRGYTTQNGTYVAPHYQSSPNGTQFDNWGTRGNQNPYTGAYGHRRPQW